MARNRMLNPEFWLDEELAALSAHARLLYMGLWGICDDNYATFPNKPQWIKIQVFPYEAVNTHELLDELEKIGKIVKFISGGSEFYWLKNFTKHQKVDHPSRPKYPKYSVPRGVLAEGSVRARPELSNELSNKGENSLKSMEAAKAALVKKGVL